MINMRLYGDNEVVDVIEIKNIQDQLDEDYEYALVSIKQCSGIDKYGTPCEGMLMFIPDANPDYAVKCLKEAMN